MAICNLYFQIAAMVASDPAQGMSMPLDKLAIVGGPFSYIGQRHDLRSDVLECVLQVPGVANGEDGAREWFSGYSNWDKNSGSFPDFVLAHEGAPRLRRGALIELKNSKAPSIASFNSTIPAKDKRIDDLDRGVQKSVRWFDAKCVGQCPNLRPCFYLVRTLYGKPDWRVSLVDGAFFETVPPGELLSGVFKDLMAKAGVDDMTAESVAKKVASLGRREIAITRQQERASIKPRLRLMSEVHPEGNPHMYAEVPARTVNLILKSAPEPRSVDDAVRVAAALFGNEGLEVEVEGGRLTIGSLSFSVGLIHHKRNGTFVLVQAGPFG